MPETNFKCPACEYEFEKKAHKRCPNCKVELKNINVVDPVRKSGRHRRFTVVADPNAPEVKAVHAAKNKPPSVEEGKEGVLISSPGDVPEVYDLGEVSVTNRHGGTRTVHKYRCEWNGIVYTGWVYCPGCWRKLYQNQMIDTGTLVQEYQCKDCHAITQFVFSSNRLPVQFR